MANVIEILINARDNASGVLNKTGSSAKSFTSGLNSIVQGATGVNLATVGMAGAVFYAGKALVDVANQTRDYNLQMADMALAMGTSIEEASKLYQISDDLRLNADTLKVAFRQMTSEGLQPNIETLASLADKYVSIEDPIERAQFAADKFGTRAGPEMKKLLSQGGQAIRDMADDVNAGLVATEEGARAAEEYYLAVDNLTDSWMSFKMTVGNSILPLLTDLLDGEKENARAINAKIAELKKGMAIQKQYGQDTAATEKEIKRLADQLMTMRDAQYRANSAQKEGETQANNLKESYDQLMDAVGSSATESFAKFQDSQSKLGEQADDLRIKIADLSIQPYLTDEQRTELDESKSKLKEIEDQIGDNQTAHDIETKKFIFNMLAKKLAADGEISALDQKLLESAAANWGLADQTMVSWETTTDSIVEGFNNGTLSIEGALAALNALPKRVTVGIDFVTNAVGGILNLNTDIEKRASGGSVSSNTPYIVGERGPELFTPSSNGSITPNDKIGGNTIVINYSPQASFATSEELKRNLVPLVRQALRSA